MDNRRVVALVIAMLAILGSPRVTRAAQQSAAPRPACTSSAHQINEARFVPVGGVEQWLTITATSCANPVILSLHGGPGNTLSPYSKNIFASWEKHFTLVQWDQRGAGRTFGRNPPAPDTPLTLERMRDDGIEVVEYLVRRLGHPKVILVGGSWGSILAVYMIDARPDLFHVYVGFAQVVSYRENQAASYDKVTAAARAADDQATLAALASLGPPPWTNPRNYGVLRRATRAYEAKSTDPAPASWWIRSSDYDTVEQRASYTEGEDYSYLQFVGLQGNGMFSRVDLSALGNEFKIPVLLAHGAEDLVTVPDVAKQFFDRIVAAEKRFVLVPRAGHDPNRRLLDALYELVKDYAPRRGSPR